MARYNTIFQSREFIHGSVYGGQEWIEYEAILTVKDGGKLPVTLDMNFIPPQPYVLEMPEQHQIKAESVTGVYRKLLIFLQKHSVQFSD